MSGKSGANNKDSKINRMLTRLATAGLQLTSIDAFTRAILKKLERIFSSQASTDKSLVNIEATLRLNHETDQATITRLTDSVERFSNSFKLATETADRLEVENDRLREYFGSVLFQRRQGEASVDVKHLQALARVALNADDIRSDVRHILTKIVTYKRPQPEIPILSDRLEPHWGNHDHLPHKTTEPV